MFRGEDLPRRFSLQPFTGRVKFKYSGFLEDAAWYYVKGAVDVLLYLEQAGDGRRSVRLELCRLPPQQCKLVEEKARAAWNDRFTTRQVEKWLEALEFVS